MNKISARTQGVEVQGWYCEIGDKPYIVTDEAIIEHTGKNLNCPETPDNCWNICPIDPPFSVISE